MAYTLDLGTSIATGEAGGISTRAENYTMSTVSRDNPEDS